MEEKSSTARKLAPELQWTRKPVANLNCQMYLERANGSDYEMLIQA